MIHDDDTTQPASIQTLGRYQILRRIGRGGMGDVWLCEDPRLHRQVAIKTLPTHSQSDREFSLRFEREAQAAAALNHPHILPVHDYGEQPLSNGQVITYIVMPYISGGSLADRITLSTSNNTGIPLQEAIAYLSQAAEAIDYAHNQGVVHRDIKPGNMLLRSDNWLLLADFGIARILSSQEQMTQAGVGIGTPEYMAPEQAIGKAEAASDNYSLAVVAYQLFTGQLPFTADTGYAITIQHMAVPPPSPRHLNPNLSPAFEEVLLRGLSKEPQQRLQSARAFVAELQRILTNAPFEATYVSSPLSTTLAAPINTPDGRGPITRTIEQNSKLVTPQESKHVVTRRQVIIGGSAALLAAGGVGAWFVASHSNNLPSGQNTTSTGKTVVSSSAPTPTPGPDDPALTLLGHNQPVRSLAWAPQTNTLISAGREGQVLLWDVQALSQQKSPSTRPTAKQTFDPSDNLLVAWSPNGKYIAIGNGRADVNAQTTSVFVYTDNLGTTAPGYDNPIVVPDSISVDALSWSKLKYIVTLATPISFISKSQFLLRLWDTTQQTLKLEPATISGLLTSTTLSYGKLLSSSPDGSLLAIAVSTNVVIGEVSVSRKAAKWQQRSRPLQILDNGFEEEVDGVTWSPDGKYVAAFSQRSGNTSVIAWWRWKEGKQVPVPLNLPSSDTGLTTLSWCPNPSSTLIAAGSKNGTVYVWDTKGSGVPVRILEGSKAGNKPVGALEWSADGTWLAAGYQDVNASILVWNMTPR